MRQRTSDTLMTPAPPGRVLREEGTLILQGRRCPPTGARAPTTIPQGEERRPTPTVMGAIPPVDAARRRLAPPQHPIGWSPADRHVSRPRRLTSPVISHHRSRPLKATLHRRSANLGERLATAGLLASRREDSSLAGESGGMNASTRRSCRRMGSRRLPTSSLPHPWTETHVDDVESRTPGGDCMLDVPRWIVRTGAPSRPDHTRRPFKEKAIFPCSL